MNKLTTSSQGKTEGRNEKEVFPCDGCNRIFSSKGGRTNHQRKCKGDTVPGAQKLKEDEGERGDEKTADEAHALTSNGKNHDVNDEQNYDRPPPSPPPTIFKWGEYHSFHFLKILDDAYEQIVKWRKNLFMLPS